MYNFGKESLDQLQTCHDDLQMLFNYVVTEYDCKVLEGYRTPERQVLLVEEEASRTLNSKHNHMPSQAVDISPYPIPEDWGETNCLVKARFYHFAGYVLACAQLLDIKVRWGGDWDSDLRFDDQKFNDLLHWELI